VAEFWYSASCVFRALASKQISKTISSYTQETSRFPVTFVRRNSLSVVTSELT
jgi:hypothetical protein